MLLWCRLQNPKVDLLFGLARGSALKGSVKHTLQPKESLNQELEFYFWDPPRSHLEGRDVQIGSTKRQPCFL